MALGGLTGIGSGNCKMPLLEVRTQMTFEGRLREEKENLEKRLTNINAILEQLETNPDMAKFMEALNKLGY